MDETPFTYATAVTVRFRDLDPMKQVHNGVVLQYVEEARVRYFRDVLEETITELSGAIAHQDIDYRAPITYGAAVTVRYRVSRVGGSSITMQFEVTADDEIAASGEVVHVVLDDEGSPTAVPTEWVERITQFEESPVETK